MKIIEFDKIEEHLLLLMEELKKEKAEALRKNDSEWMIETNRELVTYSLIYDWIRNNTKELTDEQTKKIDNEKSNNNQRSNNKTIGLSKRRRNTNSGIGLSDSE